MGYKIFEYDPLLLPYKRHIELRMEKYEKKVEIIQAKQGVKKQLLDMAEKNAADYLSKSVNKIKHKNS